MASPQKENGYTPIANEIMEALAKIRIPGEARQVLDIILRMTYGYHKKLSVISTLKFMQLTGLSRSCVYKVRRKLKEINLITISKKGDSQLLTYSFQKDYHKWILSPKKDTISKKGDTYLQKRTKTISKKGDSLIVKDIKITNKDMVEVRNYFYTTYQTVFNTKYVANFGKDGKIFQSLVEILPTDKLKSLIDKFFQSQDEFIKEAGYTVGVFKSQINKLQGVQGKKVFYD